MCLYLNYPQSSARARLWNRRASHAVFRHTCPLLPYQKLPIWVIQGNAAKNSSALFIKILFNSLCWVQISFSCMWNSNLLRSIILPVSMFLPMFVWWEGWDDDHVSGVMGWVRWHMEPHRPSWFQGQSSIAYSMTEWGGLWGDFLLWTWKIDGTGWNIWV